VANEPPLNGKAWSDEWERQHQDPRAEMLCSAHEGTWLVELRADRAVWTTALHELSRLGLIEFYVESFDEVEGTSPSTPLSDADGLAALGDSKQWEPHEGSQIGFGTTAKGELAIKANAFHNVDGEFTEHNKPRP
jgi:hypothetical protein